MKKSETCRENNSESIWCENIKKPQFASLTESKNVDVLVIGGGIAGILCAYKLKNAGVDCMLLEAKKICSGITKNTTAKISIQHGLIYDKIIRRFGEERAQLYLNAQQQAFEEYAKICKTIPCDYERRDSYVFSLNDAGKIEKEISAMERLGLKAEFSACEELPFSVAGAVALKGEAAFHPLKFLFSIAKDLPIYEDTKVIELKPFEARTNHGSVRFKKLVIATHFPILNKHGLYPLKLYQHRSYVIALKNAQKLNGMYVDESDTGMSFRGYKDYLLLGGGGHRTGKRGAGWHELEKFKDEYYKGASTVSKWATQDCMTLDGVPYIGQYSKETKNVFVATGFNKWGMTNAMATSNIISDLVMERENALAKVFYPSRSILTPQLAVNIFESIIGLITPTVPRCPHLGCALKYNKAEHSWDCPCHGSRFALDGKLIDNPATDDKRM